MNGQAAREGLIADPAARARLVVAIPAYNEEVGIGSVVLRTREHARDVVVVDDGSTDDTARVAELAGARVIRHASNGGYGAALRTIFRTARNEGWEALAILDSDGQHDPSDLPEVAGPVLAGKADVSIGSRFVEAGSASDVPAYRKLGIKVLTSLGNVGARGDARVTDGQSGFRAYSRRAIEAIDPTDDDMGISAEILFQARKAGLAFAEVPIRVRYDVDGSSQNPVRHGLGVVRSIARFAEVEHPFLVLGLPGLALFLLGLLVGASELAGIERGDASALAIALAAAVAFTGFALGLTSLVLHAFVSATRGRAA
ncbi:MAG TPA: glycosyltransferase family 2 protein [Candidatus Thermoplasmatota archaeon]|nr:glycosyltransferase family 2 protein [Candidatus Thermoplasmatota archaeon]